MICGIYGVCVCVCMLPVDYLLLFLNVINHMWMVVISSIAYVVNHHIHSYLSRAKKRHRFRDFYFTNFVGKDQIQYFIFNLAFCKVTHPSNDLNLCSHHSHGIQCRHFSLTAGYFIRNSVVFGFFFLGIGISPMYIEQQLGAWRRFNRRDTHRDISKPARQIVLRGDTRRTRASIQ